MGLKNAPNLKHAENIPDAEEGQRNITFFFIRIYFIRILRFKLAKLKN